MDSKLTVLNPSLLLVEKAPWKPGEYYVSETRAEILREMDVVVCGGGTAGVVAAIAAARNGARTTLVENRGFLGGMLTGGNAGVTMFTKFSGNDMDHSRDVKVLREDPEALQVAGGIAMELIQRLMREDNAVSDGGVAGAYVFTASEDFKRLLLRTALDAGVKLRLHTMVVDVVKDGPEIKGVILESKSGRQLLPARQFIDATGDGDVAARAGARFVCGISEYDICASKAKSGETMTMGVMFRVANVDLEKTFQWMIEDKSRFRKQPFGRFEFDEVYKRFRKHEMFTMRIWREGDVCMQVYNSPVPGLVTLCCPQIKGLDGCRAEDLSHAEELMCGLLGRWQDSYRCIPGFEHSYMIDIPEIGVRESRHVIGDVILGIEEIYQQKQYDDCIGFSSHPIDIDPRPAWLDDPSGAYPPRWFFQIPFRSLTVKGFDNLLTAGRCISATHEASGCIRPTVPCMVTGQAAGTASALAVRAGGPPRSVPSDILRQTLLTQGVKC